MGVRRFFRRAAWDAERTREMHAHLQMQVDDYVAGGMAPQAARQRALREFGNLHAIREDIYQMNTITFVEHLVRDARYAARVLRRSPGFTVTALLTLALAIGVNTAVFSIVDAALLKPLPFPAPDRLTLVSSTIRDQGETRTDIAQHGLTWETIRDRDSTVHAAVFSSWPAGVNLVTGSTGVHVQQQRVGAGFFRVLGVAPALGREFSSEEDVAGGPAAAILSEDLWRRLYGADPSVVGRSITLRGESYRVVGVMPRGFRTSVEADVWTPLRASRSGEGDGENFNIVARLRDGVTLAAAQAEIRALGVEIFRQKPSRPGVTVDYSLVPMQAGLAAPVRQTLLMVWAAVAVILLIACVNLSGLMIARASSRRREIATRIALGSGTPAVLRQALVESVVLAVAGGAIGPAVGQLTLTLLQSLTKELFEIARPPSLDGRAVLAAALLSLGASVVFGIAPAIVTARMRFAGTLSRAGGRAATAVHGWPRKLLLVAQVALGVVLLVAAGLLLRSFTHLRGLQPGFNPEGVTVASVSLQDARYRDGARIQALFNGTLERLRGTPGVTAAAVSLAVPYERLLNLGFRQLDGAKAGEPGRNMTSATYVSDGFFDTLQIAASAGRVFDARDSGSGAAVAVVNETFARTYFPDAGPTGVVGRRIGIAGRDREIVGVVADVQVRPGWGEFGPLAPMPLTYLPVAQVNEAFMRVVHGWFSPAFVVRASSGTDTTAAVRRAIDAHDPLLPLAKVRSMEEIQGAAIAPARLLMALLATLAGAAVLLAGIGIHGLIATSVTERTREMAIRMALGSTPESAMRAIALPGAVLAVIGVLAGVPLAVMFSRLVRHLIWGVRPGDPTTFAAAAILLVAVAAIASAAPALRILKLDPATALRHE